MPIANVLVLLAVCCLLSLLVGLPIIWIVRFARRKRPEAVSPRMYSRAVPPLQLLWFVLILGAILLGFAQEYVAPQTWFGQQMKTWTGKVTYTAALYLASIALNIAWRLFWLHRARRILALLAQRGVDIR